MKIIGLIGIILGQVLCTNLVHSQIAQHCDQAYEDALKAYYSGDLSNVENILGACLAELSIAQRAEGNRLIIISSLVLGNNISAEAAMLRLLQVDKEYELRESDPPEFVKLYHSFRTTPILSIGPQLGGHTMLIDQQILSGTYNLNSPSKPNYSTSTNPQVGLSVEFDISKSFTLNQEMFWMTQDIRKELLHPTYAGTNIEENTSITETQQWIQLPFSAQYRLAGTKLVPYFSVGLSLDFLIKAEIVGEESTRIVEVENGLGRVYTLSLDLTGQRNRILLSPFGALGVKRKLGLGYVTANIRFYYGLMNLGKEDVTYNIPSVWEINSTNDVFRQHQIALNLGYILKIYRPKMISKESYKKK